MPLRSTFKSCVGTLMNIYETKIPSCLNKKPEVAENLQKTNGRRNGTCFFDTERNRSSSAVVRVRGRPPCLMQMEMNNNSPIFLRFEIIIVLCFRKSGILRVVQTQCYPTFTTRRLGQIRFGGIFVCEEIIDIIY